MMHGLSSAYKSLFESSSAKWHKSANQKIDISTSSSYPILVQLPVDCDPMDIKAYLLYANCNFTGSVNIVNDNDSSGVSYNGIILPLSGGDATSLIIPYYKSEGYGGSDLYNSSVIFTAYTNASMSTCKSTMQRIIIYDYQTDPKFYVNLRMGRLQKLAI